MSQAQLFPAEHVSLPPITYKGLPVVTTEMLAQAYGCAAKNIRVNFANNKERFVEGKHYFNITNGDLNDFRLQAKNLGSQIISPKVRNLTLWTEWGALYHAKSIGTDQTWAVYETLVITFFRVVKEEPPKALPAPDSRLSKRSDPERKALAAVKSVWVSMAAIGYKDASALVNAHFGVSGVDEMTVTQCKEAVEWIQAKIDALQLAQQALPTAEEQAALPAMSREEARDYWHEALKVHERTCDIATHALNCCDMLMRRSRENLTSAKRLLEAGRE